MIIGFNSDHRLGTFKTRCEVYLVLPFMQASIHDSPLGGMNPVAGRQFNETTV